MTLERSKPKCIDNFDAENDACWECAWHPACKSKAPKPLTGWDLGLLHRLEFSPVFRDVAWCHQALISEVGWPKGGEKETYGRLMNLWRHGCLTMRIGMSDMQTLFQFYKYPDISNKEALSVSKQNTAQEE